MLQTRPRLICIWKLVPGWPEMQESLYSRSHSPNEGENLYSCSPSAPKPQSSDKKPLICPSCLILRHPHVRIVCSECSWQVTQKVSPCGTYKSHLCVFNPCLTQALVKTILYETCSCLIWNVEVVETHMPVLSQAFSTAPHPYKHILLPVYFPVVSALKTVWLLSAFFFFAETVSKNVATADIFKHLTISSGQHVLSQEPRQRSPREDIIILLHLPDEKLPTEANKQTSPYFISLLADSATGIQKEQIMESKKRLLKQNHNEDAYCETGKFFSGYLQIDSCRESNSVAFGKCDTCRLMGSLCWSIYLYLYRLQEVLWFCDIFCSDC